MRFSYIDSQGKEIEVDSVESLALRIELGAIEPDTRMYDAVADRWAPAEEHPVFRSLSRGEELTEEDVIPIGSEEDEGKAEAVVAEPEEDAGGDADEEVPEAASDDPLGLDFQVEMKEGDEGGPAIERSPAAEGVDEADEGEEGGFDFEGFDADAVELDESEVQELEPGSDRGAEDEEEDGGAAAPWAAEEAGLVWDEAVEEDEADEEDTAPSPQGGLNGRMPRQVPLDESELPEREEAEELPPWARDAPSWDEEPEEPAPPAGDGGAAGAVEAEPREAPARPAHWDERAKSRERKVRLRKVAGGAVVVVLGAVAGAYFAGVGPFEGIGSGGEEVAEEPLVPVLPEALRATLNAAGDEAWAAAVSRALARDEATALPRQPPEEWLEGIYLSTAADYPRVGEYWTAVGDFLSSVRSRARDAFPEELRSRLEAVPEAEGEVERLVSVAVQELELSAPRREEAVHQILTVADASVALHELLVTRQDDIAYEPYSDPGVSRDPVLEAVAETEELENEMNARLDRVLEAIEESGLPRPITTRRTLDRLAERLRAAGWRYREPYPGG